MGGGGGGGEEHVRGISELSTVFTVVFVITLFALLAQLLYLLVRRRQSSSSSAVSFAAHPPSSFCSKTGDSNTNSNNECPISSSALKLHCVFGPPRFLFTIKEEDDDEERAEEDDDSGSNVRIMSLKRCFDDDHDDGDVEGGGGTPFSTPCCSPAFFTPVDSPVHAVVSGGPRDEEMGLG